MSRKESRALASLPHKPGVAYACRMMRVRGVVSSVYLSLYKRLFVKFSKITVYTLINMFQLRFSPSCHETYSTICRGRMRA